MYTCCQHDIKKLCVARYMCNVYTVYMYVTKYIYRSRVVYSKIWYIQRNKLNILKMERDYD